MPVLTPPSRVKKPWVIPDSEIIEDFNITEIRPLRARVWRHNPGDSTDIFEGIPVRGTAPERARLSLGSNALTDMETPRTPMQHTSPSPGHRGAVRNPQL